MNYLENDQDVSETLQVGIDYTIVKDKSGYEFKYVNFNKPGLIKRDGLVEIKQMKQNLTSDGKRKHNQEVRFKRYTDSATGLLWGLHKGVNNSTGNIAHEEIVLEGDMLFDLKNKKDAVLCAIILNSPFVEGSPNQVGRPLYKVFSKEAEAAKSVDKRSLRRKCEDIIESLAKQDKVALEEMARNIGVHVEANRYGNMLLDEVYRIMENDPRKFLDIYNNPNREYITIFNRALSKGILKEDFASGTFMYGAIHLGYSKDDAIGHLVNDSSMASTIKVQCDALDKGTLKSMANTNFGKDDSSKDAEIAKLRAELAKHQPKAEKIEGSAPVIGTMQSNEDADEYAKLLERAKELKIKSPHFIKTVEGLKAKIEEAENA
jgi:hypothetical protein